MKLNPNFSIIFSIVSIAEKTSAYLFTLENGLLFSILFLSSMGIASIGIAFFYSNQKILNEKDIQILKSIYRNYLSRLLLELSTG